MSSKPSAFVQKLHCESPAPERAKHLELYGWLIGDWQTQWTAYREDRSIFRGPGEIHFGWVLDGYAIQDLWSVPGEFRGTTLRVYDPGPDAWHIFWSDPVRQYHARQLGRAQGKDIVQLGTNDAGEQVRWSFVDIAPDSFRWLGERLRPDGKSWELQSEHQAKRVR